MLKALENRGVEDLQKVLLWYYILPHVLNKERESYHMFQQQRPYHA